MIKEWEATLKKTEKMDCPRISLRRFNEADEQDIFEFASDAETLCFLDWEGVKDIDGARNSIKTYYCINPGVFAIEEKESGKCIGAIDLRMIPEHEKAGFGYMLNRDYWNKGYMTETLNAMLSFAFEILELNRVESMHYFGNEASGRVMQKCGMKYEGMALQEFKIKGEFRDALHYGVLQGDWLTQNAFANTKATEGRSLWK